MSLTTSSPRSIPVALAAAAIVGSVVLTAAPALAVAPSALVLNDAAGVAVTEGDATANPSFASATLTAGCPDGAQDAARLSVTADASVVVVSPTISTDGARPVTVPLYSSFSEVVPAGVDGGGATLTLECLAVAGGIPVTVVPAATVPVAFSAGRWAISSTPTPSPTPTEASPAPSATGSAPTTSPSAASSAGLGASASPSTAGSVAGRPSSGLANTGAQVTGVVGIGIGLLALVAGALLIAVRRRRRSTSGA